jgi:peptidoglycan/LPS O-acetylase OafA/YrhL
MFSKEERSSSKGSAAERPHIPALDGLRGVAILLVLFRHVSSASPQPFNGLGSIYNNFVSSFGWGVVLFFVLSGFLITGILLDSKESPNYYLNFYGRRILRIFPLYYGTIAAFTVVALLRHAGSPSQLFLHRLPWLLTYTTNLRIALHNDWSFVFNGHSLAHFWSLAVEEQFYFVWPLIVFRYSTHILKHVCLVAIAGGFISKMVLLYGFHDDLGSVVFLPCESDALAMGALVAVLAREQKQLAAALAWPAAITGAAIWLASILDGNALLTAGSGGFAIMSAGAIALCLYHPIAKWFTNPALRSFGKYSYGIYVLHVIVLPYLWPIREKLGGIAFALFVFMPVSYGAGWLSWHLFEVHFLKLKKYFPTSTQPSWMPGLQLQPAKTQAPISRITQIT